MGGVTAVCVGINSSASDKAHKILHTSEKMDTINPTIELTRSEGPLELVHGPCTGVSITPTVWN